MGLRNARIFTDRVRPKKPMQHDLGGLFGLIAGWNCQAGALTLKCRL